MLWPADQVAARVVDRQISQQRNHTNKPRSFDAGVCDPVLIRNYAPGSSRRLAASIGGRTGPLSYMYQLPSGDMVKRVRDQIIYGRPVSLVSEITKPVETNKPGSEADTPRTDAFTAVSDSSGAFNVSIYPLPNDLLQTVEPVVKVTGGLLRSTRVRKRQVRLNL